MKLNDAVFLEQIISCFDKSKLNEIVISGDVELSLKDKELSNAVIDFIHKWLLDKINYELDK